MKQENLEKKRILHIFILMANTAFKKLGTNGMKRVDT